MSQLRDDQLPTSLSSLASCPFCSGDFVPGPETLEAMRELEEGLGKRAHSIDELMAQLNADDD